MAYKCKRCGKTSTTRSGLRCDKCDTREAQLAGTSPIYSMPPSFSETVDTGNTSSSSSDFSGGSGNFGGGGASGDY